jgi:imidazoleglycerol-phosphate dehydratase
VKFLDHMLDAFAKHAGCGLTLRARGDGMDHHHLVEDVGIALGSAIAQALGDKHGIARFGSMAVPLDDALVLGSVDLSGRAWSNFAVTFGVENLGDLKTELIPHFFHSVSENGRFNLHLVQTERAPILTISVRPRSRPSPARSRMAKEPTSDASVPSTKGLLA